jgi:hypothetical protein
MLPSFAVWIVEGSAEPEYAGVGDDGVDCYYYPEFCC